MHLPSDIAREILSRLPVKSILRFRSVSKAWLSFIENPRFVSLQFSRSTNNPNPNHTFICFNVCDNQAYIIEAKNPNSFKSTKLDLGFPCEGIVGESCSVNGISAITVATMYSISTYIINPIRRGFVKLPDIKLNGNRIIWYSNSIGFGYDSSTDMYKVIVVLQYRDGREYEVQIFTLGSSSWRRVETVPVLRYAFHGSGIVSGNNLHWCTLYGDYILTFDLRSESFGSLPYPQFNSYDERKYLQILNLNGSLSLASYPSFEDRILLWIRKDESCTKP